MTTPHLKFEVTVMCAFDILCDVDQVRAAFLRAVRTTEFALPGTCLCYVEPLPDGTVLGPKKRFRLTVAEGASISDDHHPEIDDGTPTESGA